MDGARPVGLKGHAESEAVERSRPDKESNYTSLRQDLRRNQSVVPSRSKLEDHPLFLRQTILAFL